ncbi:undecaprenyldiphospho-muramoylpentapeptide beta-N-acetylglucosaminyltransferase [Vallitalea okinawensis]|uniref:undecaprenyldiphospho-muramoylpentapeptide beta-N-acetylglucosaminyltransferase n=1 Tax=Vallitalea okinawensis TaxID=2078660 RepID=UPI000CFC541C|nr:undecaprenyldiphospho-muramoylpentapeptide beta-N-acetylglucosaminyltransferase [Vallitalea okinawensis]
MKKKTIILTGGGTAGHVTPNIALLPYLKKRGYDIHYIGTYEGIERKLIEEQGITYHGISSGKLRRYFDVKNFTDPFKVLKGLGQSIKLVSQIKPDVIFSKGGFVTVPVIMAGKMKGIPTIIHESDMTPGLANKIAIPFSNKVCTTFPETMKHLPSDKAVLTGTPIREEIFKGSKEKGANITGFNTNKPVLMLVGGSLGSVKLNTLLRANLDELLKTFQIIHLCGKGNVESSIQKEGYIQYDYVKDELTHLFALSDLIISRAGANSISEIIALKKPNILIPLSANASRGDQILNARSFNKQGFSYVLDEDTATKDDFLKAIDTVFKNRNQYVAAMKKSNTSNGIQNVLDVIEKAQKN